MSNFKSQKLLAYMKENRVEFLVKQYSLQKHPEGGYYKEMYRSKEFVSRNALPDRFSGDRSFLTSIYFLLEKDSFSAFHRIKSDELWYFHQGDNIDIHIILPDGTYLCEELGKDKQFQCMVPAGAWFASNTKGEYSLVSCAVAPGFDFEDFELAEKKELISIFPQYQSLIEEFCRN